MPPDPRCFTAVTFELANVFVPQPAVYDASSLSTVVGPCTGCGLGAAIAAAPGAVLVGRASTIANLTHRALDRSVHMVTRQPTGEWTRMVLFVPGVQTAAADESETMARQGFGQSVALAPGAGPRPVLVPPLCSPPVHPLPAPARHHRNLSPPLSLC